MVDLFKKNNEIKKIPTELVMQMQQQGLSNNQIVQSLQREGYSTDQIYQAMNQSEIKSKVAVQQPEEFAEPSNPMIKQAITFDKIEEITESIIDERWNAFSENIKKIIDWKERSDVKITKIQTEIEQVKENIKNLEQAVLGKINDYDEHITNVGTEIKALEKVFQKIIPELTENVSELGRIKDDFKK